MNRTYLTRFGLLAVNMKHRKALASQGQQQSGDPMMEHTAENQERARKMGDDYTTSGVFTVKQMMALAADCNDKADRIAQLEEALRLADAALSGAHMDMSVVKRKVSGALAIEARRAATLGAVHESAGRNGNAQGRD